MSIDPHKILASLLKPHQMTVLAPCHPSQIKVALMVVVTLDNRVELSGPVNDENVCVHLLEKGIERIKQVHRGRMEQGVGLS